MRILVLTVLVAISVIECKPMPRSRVFDALGLGIGKRHLARAVVGSVSTRCNRIAAAFNRIVVAMAESSDDAQAQQIAQKVMKSSGVDINDPDNIRAKACQLAEIKSVADMAASSGVPIDTARQQYAMFAEYARLLLTNLRTQATSYYNRPGLRRIYAATADFYATLEEMGYFDLE